MLINRLIAYAIAVTPVSFEHACYFLEQLMVRVPGTDFLRRLIQRVLWPQGHLRSTNPS